MLGNCFLETGFGNLKANISQVKPNTQFELLHFTHIEESMHINSNVHNISNLDSNSSIWSLFFYGSKS